MKEGLDLELQQGKRKAAKPMMWISMVSMTMMFAGLTSAYVISSSREDWVSFDLPQAFVISSVCIVLSSFTFFIAKQFLKKDDQKLTRLFLMATLFLGLAFVYEQYQGFLQLKQMGLYFTGPNSEVSSSMLMVIVFAHVLHVAAGVVCLLVVVLKQFLNRYNSKDMLGFELAAIFWHFVDLLWIGLFLFFYFNT
ncbi:MAG: cytochrome c oxidase subunit 3 [Flavicella sp.]